MYKLKTLLCKRKSNSWRHILRVEKMERSLEETRHTLTEEFK